MHLIVYVKYLQSIFEQINRTLYMKKWVKERAILYEQWYEIQSMCNIQTKS